MRRLTAVLLILILALSAAGASAKSVYTLDIYWIGNTESPGNDDVRHGVEEAVNEYIEPLIDANVSFHIINWDNWSDKALTPLMEGEKVDLIFTADWRDYVQEINAGVLSGLDGLLETDGRDILDSLSGDFLEGVRYKGAIYGIPTNKELCVPTGLIVNKTAALAIGWDPEDGSVTRTEDLEPWLARYKELFPDNYPYLMEKGRWSDEPWGHEWIGLEEDVLSMKYARNGDGEFDETVYSIYETEEQEEHIRLMYRWAQAGYIDPGAADYDYNHIFGTGRFLVFTQPLKGNNIKSKEMYVANKAPDAEDFECTEIVLQDKYKVTCQAGGSMFAIPKSCHHRETAMRYLNLMHSDPVLVNLMLFGREGVNYTRVNDRQVEITAGANWYGIHGGAWTVGDIALQYVLTNEDPDKNELLQKYAEDAEKTASYGFRFDKSKAQEQVDAVTAAVQKYARGLMVGAVDPDDPERGLEAFRRALKEAGIDALKEEVERQYEIWKAAQW